MDTTEIQIKLNCSFNGEYSTSNEKVRFSDISIIPLMGTSNSLDRNDL